MIRRWLTLLPLAFTVAGTLAFPATASADSPPTAPCTKDTQEVTDLVTTVTNLGTAVTATPIDPTTLGQAAGDVFNATIAAQTAGCLPALPTSAPVTPPAAPPPSTHAQDTDNCASDTIDMLTAALRTSQATLAKNPTRADLLNAVGLLSLAVTSVNTDKCLPDPLSVPTLPVTPPVPPVAPVS